MTANYEAWVKAVFDHAVRKPDWYWDDEFDAFWDRLGMTDALTVDYMTRLFSSPRLESFSRPQIAQGIWFLIGESSPGRSAYALLNADVEIQGRIACVRSISNFFTIFIAPLASGPADTDADPLHIACWMWWDIFPTYDGQNSLEPELQAACLQVMSEMLRLPSELCQLSALHGLNHWHQHHADLVVEIVDSFLQSGSALTGRVAEYAAIARLGVGP